MSKTSKRKKKQNQKPKPKPQSIDRISQLPEHIQHNILNFLEEKAVARTRVLSKAWTSTVHSRPVLDFDQCHFRSKPTSENHEIDLKLKECFFINHINESIERVGSNVQRFSLHAQRFGHHFLSDLWDHNLNRWVQQLVQEAKLNDLYIVLDRNDKDRRYSLPPFVLLSERITRLTLGQCKLGRCSDVSLPNLLALSLSDVALTREMIEKFQSGCPGLEALKLHRCDGSSSICVSGLPRLSRVELILPGRVNRVKIVSPELRIFKVSHDDYYRAHDTKIDLLACESSMRKLGLSCIDVTDDWLTSFVSKFLGLESLELGSLDLNVIEIPNRNLRKLKVVHCRRLRRIDSDAIDLRALAYRHNKLPFYSTNSNLTFVARFFSSFTIHDAFRSLSSGFEEFLFHFNRIGNLKFIVFLDKDVIVYEDLDENFIDMFHRLKEEYDQKSYSDDENENENVREVEVIRTASYEYTIDYIFGYFEESYKSYDKMETLSIVSRKERNNKIVLEVLRKNTLKENEEPNCCAYDSYRCYRHLLSSKKRENEKSKCCTTHVSKCWRHELYDAKMTGDEMEGASNWFKSFDTTEYDVTCIELGWI